MKHNNKPLALEELRQMVGKPVWIENIKYPSKSRFAIIKYVDMKIDVVFQDAFDEFSLLVSMYGKAWLAYGYNSYEDLLRRADKAMEDTITLYLIEHDADDRKRWRSFNKLIHQRKQQLESAQQQLEGILDMFEREYRMI